MPFFVDKKHYSAQRIDLATDTNPETSSAVYTSVAEPAFLEWNRSRRRNFEDYPGSGYGSESRPKQDCYKL